MNSLRREPVIVVAGAAIIPLLALGAAGWRLNALKQEIEHPDDIVVNAVIQRVAGAGLFDANRARTSVPGSYR